MAPLNIKLEFSGGAELLLDGVKNHDLTLPESDTPWTIKTLLVHIRDNFIKERPELFMQVIHDYELKIITFLKLRFSISHLICEYLT